MKNFRWLAAASLAVLAAGIPAAASAQDWHGRDHDRGWHGDWHRAREERIPDGWRAGPGWHHYWGVHHRHCWWGYRWNRPVRYCNW